jgi:hypothetical protein
LGKMTLDGRLQECFEHRCARNDIFVDSRFSVLEIVEKKGMLVSVGDDRGGENKVARLQEMAQPP